MFRITHPAVEMFEELPPADDLPAPDLYDLEVGPPPPAPPGPAHPGLAHMLLLLLVVPQGPAPPLANYDHQHWPLAPLLGPLLVPLGQDYHLYPPPGGYAVPPHLPPPPRLAYPHLAEEVPQSQYQLMPPYTADDASSAGAGSSAPLTDSQPPLYYYSEYPPQPEWLAPAPGFISPSIQGQYLDHTPLHTPVKHEPAPGVDAYDGYYDPHHPAPHLHPGALAPLAPPGAMPRGPMRRYRVLRGVLAGGSLTRPPKHMPGQPEMSFLLVDLQINGALPHDICYPPWGPLEKQDRRRIIRIERIQQGNKLLANFSIVGAANDHPVTLPPPAPGVDVVEVLCLECMVRPLDEYELLDDELGHRYIKTEGDALYQYYITSVEVIEIVELLIGTQVKDPAERRRERGRVRLNLVPFWLKRPISLRMNERTLLGAPTNQDYRVELAKRIMGYEIRKPRGFDKEVRILRWDKLVPALKRALQSYYTEIPPHEVDQFYG